MCLRFSSHVGRIQTSRANPMTKTTKKARASTPPEIMEIAA